MIEDVLVSVIIPVYNREQTIEMAARSVLSQTYSNLELIVVDDCSTDQSVQVVKAIDDCRVRVVACERNGGACTARNIGIEHARGEIIAFQDSDDFWHEDKLEKSLYHLEKENVDMVFSAVRRKGEKGKGTEGRIVPTYNLNLENDKFGRVLCSNCVSTQTIVIKKEALKSIRFDKALPRFQDWDFALQVLKKGRTVYYIDEPLVDCWVLGDSITRDISKAITALDILEKKYCEDFAKRQKSAYIFYSEAAYFIEKFGHNGALYFKKAYKVSGNKGMLFRCWLAKLNLYKAVVGIYKAVSR